MVTDERQRVRRVLNDLILHLHPVKVPARSLKLTYTFGLGGLSALLVATLVITGVLLLFVYTPTPGEAYNSIQALDTTIWMGQFVRNLHHWSANLLLITVVLHLLRVFYTAAFHEPRRVNWILGLCLLLLVALSNFTGYLMPWDQLSYWATTIVTSMFGYVPIVGDAIKGWLLGGPEIGPVTLRTFFAFHVVVFPLSMAFLLSYHFWRVRKDTFSIPRRLDEPLEQSRPSKLDRVTTIPHLVSIEFAVALVALLLLMVWATSVNAPLGQPANPSHPPNPAKAAWYFMGFQELLLHFHPVVVTVLIPVLVTVILIALPYVDRDDTAGIWFRSRRGRRLVAINFVLGTALAAGLVVADEFWLNRPTLLPSLGGFISNGLLPLVATLLTLTLYWRALRRRGNTCGECTLAIFTLLLMAFVTLTVIGIFFRGQNMVLTVPWKM